MYIRVWLFVIILGGYKGDHYGQLKDLFLLLIDDKSNDNPWHPLVMHSLMW